MNRPRNRQPRQNQTQHQQPQGQNHNSHRHSKPAIRVPNISQVLTGASVSIVLKADQPTGRQVQGTVQDVLTRGDHPRGIKVRLKDGRVGRVQRMVGADEVGEVNGERWPASVPTSPVSGGEPRGQRRWDGEGEGDEGMPPARSLADFISAHPDEPASTETPPEHFTFTSADIRCPFCSAFEGDEAAVSHHVQTSHLD